MTIQELENKIIEASQAYYSGNPIMNDKDFDGLINYLKAANPDSDILTKVGWGFDPYKLIGEKEPHIYGKVIGIEKKPKIIEDIPKDFLNTNILLSAKLDGLSMICYFFKGKLIKALTRGNGDTGVSRIDKVEKILEKELNIPEGFDFTGAIRGEIVISNKNWKYMLDNNIVNDNQNQRNVATGIIGRDEINDDIKFLDLIFYKVVGYEDNQGIKYNNVYRDFIINKNNYDYKFLKKFIKPEYIVDCVEDNGSLINQDDLEALFNRFKYKYLCDGVVITKGTRNITSNELKHVTNVSILNNEVAYKFITEKETTEIESIRWKMSKGNKAIPVISVKPIELSGATVSNATAFNAKYIYDNDLDIGCKVELVRSGEVIPYITQVITNSNGEGKKKLDEMVCPYCGTKLSWDGVDLVCKNKECSNRDEQNLRIWVNTLGAVDGISETLIKSFFTELNINSLEDLYNGSYEVFEYKGAAFNTHKGKFNLVLNKLFNEPIELKDLLVALNIKSLGVKNAVKLANSEFNALLQEYLDINDIDLFIAEISRKMPDVVGPALTSNICSLDGISKLNNIKLIYKSRINFNVADTKVDNKIPVVITGKLSVPRKEFEQYLNEYGYEVKGAISKDTKYLITDNPNSSSSKNKKAIELGIIKITEKDIRNIIESSNNISINDIL